MMTKHCPPPISNQTTLRLASYLGVDGLQAVLVQALADMCGNVADIRADFGNGAENDELLARISTLVGPNVRTRAPPCKAPLIDWLL